MRDAYVGFDENLSALGAKIEGEKGLADYFSAAIVNARKDLSKAHGEGTLDDDEFATLTKRLNKMEIHITNPRYHLWVARGRHEYSFLFWHIGGWQAYYLAGDGERGVNIAFISIILLLVSLFVSMLLDTMYLIFLVLTPLAIFVFLDLKRIMKENEKIREKILFDK